MRIIGEGYGRQRTIGERNHYKCSECGAEYTDIADANACQTKHFDDRQRKRRGGSGAVMALDAPSIRTKPKISVGKAASPLPPEDDDDAPVLTARNIDISAEEPEEEENDLQGLADRLMEQYK